eukprot:s839_g29.t1
MVSVIVDGWEMYVKETRPKGQRLENEVDPEKASLHMIGIAPKEADETGSSSSWQMVEAIPADLPGEPEHFEVHETTEQEVDDELIDEMLKPYVEGLPHVSDEPDQDEDEEIVFRDPIAKPFSANKIHAVEFRLDGSGVVNILNTDVTRDPAKLEMRFESMQETPDGPRIIRRYDLNDEEQHRQVERELYLEDLAPEAKLRAGDPAATIEVVSKAKAKQEASSSSSAAPSGVAQVIGDTIGQFIKPKTQDQATMASYKLAPSRPKTTTAVGTSPMASPKPSPPPTPKSAAEAKPDPPALPAEAAGPVPKKDPPVAKAPPPGTGGPQPPAEPPVRPEGYPEWYRFSPGTGELNEYVIRGNELPGLKNIAPLNGDDFRFAKRISGFLRGYEHRDLQPWHKIIPPEFHRDL